MKKGYHPNHKWAGKFIVTCGVEEPYYRAAQIMGRPTSKSCACQNIVFRALSGPCKGKLIMAKTNPFQEPKGYTTARGAIAAARRRNAKVLG